MVGVVSPPGRWMYPRSYAQYTLLERLATGGMSEVDLARRTVDEAGYVRFLVVKRIKADMVDDEAFVRMFKDEVRITSELRHTNIAQVYDFGRVEDEYFMALEYVAGTDLRAVLAKLRKQRRRMPVRMVLRIAADVLAALHYAHTRTDALGKPMNVVHRDVNPRNIMISVGGEVKLIDFGVARATDRLERTQTDHFKGKIAYMAPEQVTGGELDHRVDVFAMGLTLYEMLTGRGAFLGLDQTQILYRILQGQLPKLDVPKEWGAPGRALAELVARALEPKPEHRFRSAAAMQEAVERTASAFGGMPSVSELSAWLAEVDPGLEARMRTKMERLSGVLPSSIEQHAVAPPPPNESSLSLARQPTEEATGTGVTPRARPMMVAAAGLGTVTLVALAGVGLIALALVAVVGVSIGMPYLRSSPPEEPALADGGTEEAVEEPVVPLKVWPPPRPYADPPRVTRPSGSGSTGAAESAGGAPSVSGTAASTPTPEPVEAAERAGDPNEDGDPVASGVEEAPEDSPVEGTESVDAMDSPPAEPEEVAMGQLQVTAAKKGLIIHIDGKPTTHRTGEQFAWPVGRHTISAEGLGPTTVEVKPGLFSFVPLKPASP